MQVQNFLIAEKCCLHGVGGGGGVSQYVRYCIFTRTSYGMDLVPLHYMHSNIVRIGFMDPNICGSGSYCMRFKSLLNPSVRLRSYRICKEFQEFD